MESGMEVYHDFAYIHIHVICTPHAIATDDNVPTCEGKQSTELDDGIPVTNLTFCVYF